MYIFNVFHGSGYCTTVVSCHSCIQLLDALELIGSTDIQRLDITVVRYHSCTTDFLYFICIHIKENENFCAIDVLNLYIFSII